MSKLALFSGKPIRKKPFASPVVIDKKERYYINKVLQTREFSRFIASPSKNIDELLVMPSQEVERYKGGYFDFLGGRMLKRFEADFAKKFKIKYAISVNSATSGLIAALGAVGIGPGDEVITTCLSFNATATSILFFNAIPVFVDVGIQNFCLDPVKVEKAVTPKTKAILVVHLLGNVARMNAIMKIARKYNLKVIEDCAQAPGAKHNAEFAGTIGDMGVFSFQETKNITTGEGGMVITNNSELAKRVRLIRNHGESVPDNTWNDDELTNIIGMNFRMTELSAAIGIAQLAKLKKHNRIRTENALFLAKELKSLDGLTMPEFQKGYVPHVFAMLYHKQKTGVERNKILLALRAEGIPVGSGYMRTMYENPIFLKQIAYGKKHCPWSCHLYGRKRMYRFGDCPLAESLLKERFIWFYHINHPNKICDMQDVVSVFKKVFANLADLRKYEIKKEIEYKW